MSSYGVLQKRIIFSILLLVFYRFGTYIPIPGINIDIVREIISQSSGGFFGMFNVFSGGSLGRMTIFALNVMPYIVSSIVMQLLMVAFKSLGDLKNEGDLGRKKINFYSRIGTVLFCVLQGGVIILGLENFQGSSNSIVYDPGITFRVVGLSTLIGGTMLLVWVGEQITNRGVGNGISLIIFTGIVAELPGAISSLLTAMGGNYGALSSLMVLILLVVLLFIIVFVERSFRKIIIHYPRRQVGTRMYNSSVSHIPIKINISGVIPIIFANALLLFPVTIADFNKDAFWAEYLLLYFSPGSMLYLIMYAVLVVFFCFFYSGFVFNSHDIAEMLKKNGGFIPGKRPGESTISYLNYVVFRVTILGGGYLALVCILPELVRHKYSIPFLLGGASLLIIVNVVIEVFSQMQAYLFSHQYKHLLQKMHLGKSERGNVR